MIYLAAIERCDALPPGYPGDTDVLSRFDRLPHLHEGQAPPLLPLHR